MQVATDQRAEVVTTLASSLKAAGLSTQVIADESSWAREWEESSRVRRILIIASQFYMRSLSPSG